MKTIKIEKNTIILSIFLLLLIFIGFIIRTTNLGEPGLGTDESLHVFAAKSIIENGKPELPSGTLYTRALLYTKLVVISYKIFGINEFGARFPSVIFGTLSILLIYYIGKQFFSTKCGIYSSIIYTFSPFAIIWARECRMYSMFQFFFTFGFFALFRGIENNYFRKNSNDKVNKLSRNNRKKVNYLHPTELNYRWIIITLLLFYLSFKLQVLTSLIGPCVFIYLAVMIVIDVKRTSNKKILYNKYVILLSVLILIVVLVFIIRPKLFNLLIIHFFLSPRWSEGMSFNPIYYFNFLSSAPVFPIGVLFITGCIQIITRGEKPGIYSVICSIVPIIIITLIPSNVRGKRYIYNLLPIIILISGYSLSIILDNEFHIVDKLFFKKNEIGNKFYKLIIIVAVFSLFSASWINYFYRFAFDYYHPEAQLGTPYRNWKSACKYLNRNMKSNDIVIATEPLTASFYNCGDIQYVLTNNPNKIDYKVNNIINIFNLNDLKNVIQKNKKGWILIDMARFNTTRYIRKDIKTYLTENLPSYIIDPHGTIVVFNWDNDQKQN